MKRPPAPIKPDLPTYFLARRMEDAGMLQRGQALMLAATVGLDTKKPQKRGKSATPRGKRR